MTRLSVNVNKVATLRNTRTLGIPSVTRIADLALRAGAHGITVHPRPDERHIRKTDVAEVAEVVARYDGAEYNLEGNPFHQLIELAEAKPAQVTLVPDAEDAFTSNQGWDLVKDAERLRPIIERLHRCGARVSLFLDADGRVDLAKSVGADRIELYTEPYAAGFAAGKGAEAVRPFTQAARAAQAIGLGVNAGHDLNRDNLGYFLMQVPFVEEVSIGHALIGDALELGITETVRQYLARLGA
jgi:pyridoxine 5-phosphate synthase